MTRVRVAAVPLNQTPLDWDGNLANMRAGLLAARREGASVVCMPELCISGYGCEDAFLWPATVEMALEILRELLPDTMGMVVSVGLPLGFEGSVYNCAALLVDGRLLGFVGKRHLAGEGLHYEPRWFRPWPRGVVRNVKVFGVSVPLGDLIFDVGGVRIGFEICEDAWVEERPGFEFARAGVSLVLNPSASHFAFGKHEIRRNIVLSGVRDFNVAYVYCNLLGNEAGRAIYDGDAIIAEPSSSGPLVVAETRRLSFCAHTLACATLTLKDRGKSGEPGGRQAINASFSFPEEVTPVTVTSRTPEANECGELTRQSALARVLALGLYDYLRKTGARGFVVSLSGGADSAAVATLVWLMVRLGVAELGLEEFIARARLGISVTSERELCRALLLTAYQATKNSSEVTRSAAREVAEALDAEHHELDLEPIASAYRELCQGVIGRPLSWENDDVALQNIQARVRAPSVWMLANIYGKLLLSTSNRSEAAVGYATMDGDTAGGLCPIGGIDKAFLLKWLKFMETTGLYETGPLPALGAVTAQKPTAELRPKERAQTDEADLMPYVVLDVIERLAIARRRPMPVVLEEVTRRFENYEEADLRLWVGRFYRLFAQNQWKRERYAPSFHLDDANLDPKTWCRFPILSGGFRRELRHLEKK
jgi:NAD+ synthase (glutamine-hydrolysing)